MNLKYIIASACTAITLLLITSCGYKDIHKLNLRDRGPAGGIIFYINPDAGKDGWKYLEAAPETTEFTSLQWQQPAGLVGDSASGTAIGTGRSNTLAIKSWLEKEGGKNKNFAAILCDNLEVQKDGVVYSDWFLPSKDELNMMYINLKSGKDIKNKEYTPLGDFADTGYWSSSEKNIDAAWIQYFFYGNGGNFSKGTKLRVRAVRAF